MKDDLREIVNRSRTIAEAYLMVKEYLQARVLEALQQAGAFRTWAFLGGTALRFLYRLPRYSEDLDFSRIDARSSGKVLREEFHHFIGRIRKGLEAETYKVDIRTRSEAVVQSAFVGFPGLPHELDLSPHVGQKISIKVEIDTNPPPHAVTETSIVRRHVLLNLFHFDKSSLLAGKLHALINRPYVKGRDVYDLVWYLSDPAWPEPNMALLRASLAQTGTELTNEEVTGWRNLVANRIDEMDWKRVVEDVSPFLERSREIEMLTRANVLRLLKN